MIGVTIVAVLSGLVQFFTANFCYIARVIKHRASNIPKIRENFNDIFDHGYPPHMRFYRTDMHTKYFIEIALEIQK
jgi:hypothetical protein